MTQTPLAAIVLAAGLGTRMHSETPKHLHPLLGRRLADWVIEAVRGLDPEPLVVVTAPDAREAFEGVTVAVQEQPRGTGDAAAAARPSLEGFDGDLLVVTGDAAAITTELLRRAARDPSRGRRGGDGALVRAIRAGRLRPNRPRR